MPVQNISTIGLIGAGNIGGQLARLAVQHGYRVVISNSRGPETLSDLVAELGDHATAATAEEAAAAGDLVVVTIPLKNIDAVPVAPLEGKVVIDTNNYYPQRDGRIAGLDSAETTTAGLLQSHLPGSKVVKAFNHIYASDLTTVNAPAGTAGRRALAIYGDDADARGTVAALLDEFGFDAVDGGPVAESWRSERDQPAYVQPFDAEALREALTRRRSATSTADPSRLPRYLRRRGLRRRAVGPATRGAHAYRATPGAPRDGWRRSGDARADSLGRPSAPIAQGIEHCPPEAGAQVRILLGAHHEDGPRSGVPLVAGLLRVRLGSADGRRNGQQDPATARDPGAAATASRSSSNRSE